MTAPDGFTIFKDEPLLSKANSKDVQMHFQRLHDVLYWSEAATKPITHQHDGARQRCHSMTADSVSRGDLEDR